MRKLTACLFVFSYFCPQSQTAQTASQQTTESPTAVLESCPNLQPGDSSLPTIAGITPSDRPVHISIQFTNMYKDTKVDTWKRPDQDNICKAAAYVQQVWSSKEFKAAVESKSWTLRKKLWFFNVGISGKDLYQELTEKPVILRLSVSADKDIVPNYAISFPGGWTALNQGYVDHSGGFVCLKDNPLVSCLTNTLSHEFTHYDPPIGSTDGTWDSVNNDDFVSYGIGDLTQRLAFPSKGNSTTSGSI